MHDIPDVLSSAPLKPDMYSAHVKIQRQEDSDFMVIFSYILNLRLSLDTLLDPVSVPLLPPPKKKGWNLLLEPKFEQRRSSIRYS